MITWTHILAALGAAGVLVCLLLVFRQWKPQRLLRQAPAGATLKGRCFFGGKRWHRQGAAYLLGNELVLTDGEDWDLHFPLDTLKDVQLINQFPAGFAERLHGFSFTADGEPYWFAAPNYLLWKTHLLDKPETTQPK